MDEYLGQSIDNRFTKDSATLAKYLFSMEMPKLWAQPETLAGYSHTLLLEYICKKGGSKWGELLMTPFFGVNGDWLGIHGVTRDVTDRKHTEDALKEKASELARFNSLMIGRELKMVELKKEINEMLVKTGKPEKYIIHE
jgi:PAS domain S-box-containing protein